MSFFFCLVTACFIRLLKKVQTEKILIFKKNEDDRLLFIIFTYAYQVGSIFNGDTSDIGYLFYVYVCLHNYE